MLSGSSAQSAPWILQNGIYLDRFPIFEKENEILFLSSRWLLLLLLLLGRIVALKNPQKFF